MITLETLREQINSLHRLKTDVQIQSEIQEIFYDLIYADQMLYVKMSSSVPAISQSTLYLYSHPGMGGEAHEYADVLQMSVYALRNGAEKIILNEGDKWISISIPNFLKIFYERIYNDPNLFDYEFARLITLKNGYKLEKDEIKPCQGSQITVGFLAAVQNDQIKITMQDDSFCVPKSKLLKALEWSTPVSDWHFGGIEAFCLSYIEESQQEETKSSENDPKKPKKKLKKKSSKKLKKRLTLKMLALLCSIALILCIGGMAAGVHLNRTKMFNQFCLNVDRMDYSSAYVSYLENNFGTNADKYLASHLDGLIDGYAGNALNSGELEGALMGLENFEAIKNELEIVKATAAELEFSKNAFVEGQNESDAYRKLLAWESVIELDRVNYAAVQETVKNNQGNLVMELDKSISYYDTRAWDFANHRYEVLQYWFPENTITLSWKQKYGGESEPQSRFCPVKISKVRIKRNTNGYWDLTINWKNASVKPIQYICFSVTAIDSEGEYVISTDGSGSWSIFDAVDVNLYGAADGPASEGYGWEGAFYGPNIADVKITGINITYSDNSTDTFTNPVDLRKMQGF